MYQKVFLDGSVISRQVASGISNYVINIFKFYKLYEKKAGIETKLLLNGYPAANTHFNESALPSSDLIQVDMLDLIKTFFSGSSYLKSIYHSPYMLLPPRRDNRINLLTVHDMINFERHLSFRHKLRETFLRLAILRADYYIAISNATKIKLIDHFPHISPDRVFVVHQGISQEFFTLDAHAVNPNNKKPYLLYVGLRGEYKNFNSLVDFLLQSSYKNEMDILCVGGGGFTPAENKLIHRCNLQHAIRHAGYVSNARLRQLYTNALALAYTSLHEGFGIPIIEAMACECPVICGNFSAMKEVANGHAILVSDFSPASLDRAVKEALHFTGHQRDNAKDYAKKFTWEETSLKTLGIYRDMLNDL